MKIMISLECLTDTTKDDFRDHVLGCFGEGEGLPSPDKFSIWGGKLIDINSPSDVENKWVTRLSGSSGGERYETLMGPMWRSTRSPRYRCEMKPSTKDHRGRPIRGHFILESSSQPKANFDFFLTRLLTFNCLWEGGVFGYLGGFAGSTTVLHPTTRKVSILSAASCIPISAMRAAMEPDAMTGRCNIDCIGTTAIVYPLGSISAFIAASETERSSAISEAQLLIDRLTNYNTD